MTFSKKRSYKTGSLAPLLVTLMVTRINKMLLRFIASNYDQFEAKVLLL